MSDRVLAFYGDDVTGSTDALDALSRAGVRTALFLDPPSPETVERTVGDAEAVGVAGTSRSMTPPEMDEVLPPAFRSLAELDAPLVHYKICSTFDSAPDVGSIGRAIDLAADVFDVGSIPVVPAAPALGRHVAFGNMFARDEDDVYRLDRHPTMSEHPVTPMDEADLRRHLARQTDRSMGLVDILAIREGAGAAAETLESILDDERDVVFFDTVDEADQRTVGEVVWDRYADADVPSFVVGSSGVESALADHWTSAGLVDGTAEYEPLDPVDRLLVVSGSAAPMTATQIRAALGGGFAGVRIDTASLVDPETEETERRRVLDAAREALAAGQSVVLYTALGPDDDAIGETTERAASVPEAPENPGRYLATVQGELLATLLSEVDLTRVCVAGGDTCGHVVPRLDVVALQSRFPLDPGAPLCVAHASSETVDGMEIAMKGGQLGAEDYFVRARDGADEWG